MPYNSDVDYAGNLIGGATLWLINGLDETTRTARSPSCSSSTTRERRRLAQDHRLHPDHQRDRAPHRDRLVRREPVGDGCVRPARDDRRFRRRSWCPARWFPGDPQRDDAGDGRRAAHRCRRPSASPRPPTKQAGLDDTARSSADPAAELRIPHRYRSVMSGRVVWPFTVSSPTRHPLVFSGPDEFHVAACSDLCRHRHRSRCLALARFRNPRWPAACSASSAGWRSVGSSAT